jgi:hypothetical protein
MSDMTYPDVGDGRRATSASPSLNCEIKEVRTSTGCLRALAVYFD